MALNYLYKFDVEILYDSKRIDNSILKCSSITCDMAREKISKRDSLLFSQINKIKANYGLEELLVVFDFSNFIRKHKMEELASLKGFELKIHKLDQGIEIEQETTIMVVDFLKSNSMSKDCQVYYINAEALTKDGLNIYEELKKRVFFDFDEQDTVLSKLYAYSGTVCSDCNLLDDIKFDEAEIVVVADKNYIETSDCITMISKEFLFNELVKIKDYVKDFEFETSVDSKKFPIDKLLEFNACREFDSLYLSMDKEPNKISDELKKIISDYHFLPKTDTRIFMFKLGELIKKYDEIGSKSDQVKWERITAYNYPFDLNLFDGEGFVSMEFCKEIQESLCKKLGNEKYRKSTSFQIRLPYVKGMVHACDFRKFFKERGITEIQHIVLSNGKKYDVNKVKMILTESQFKLEAFIKQNKSKVISCVQDYIRLINEYGYSFGVIDANKEEKDVCALEYQFISTLPLEDGDIRTICNDNKWRLNNLCSKENVIKKLYNEDTYSAKLEKEMYNFNKDLYFATSKYKNRKKAIFTEKKNKALFGKFDVKGSRRYLSSDLLELLYYISYYDYKMFEKSNWLYKNQFYMPSKEPRNNKSVFLRSPHYSRNEIVLLNRRPINLHEEREEYFSHLTGLVMINLRSLAAERLGGADYDGDTVLVVNDRNIVNPVSDRMISYSEGKYDYKYLPCKIPSLKGKKYKYNDYQKRLLCFQNTFSSRVGQLSNEAFLKAEKIYSNADTDHSIMAEYTILNGLEIDSAKTGKKPEIKFSNDDTDHLLELFLECKKVYDETGSLKPMKEIIKTKNYNDRINAYNLYSDYDDDEFGDDDFDDSSSKESNNQYDYGYNILRFARCINDIVLFSNDECKKFRINIKAKKTKDFPKALALAAIYSTTNKLIRNVLSRKAKNFKMSQLNRISDQLREICSRNNIDLDDLISKLNMDNLEAFDKMNKYVIDSSFHYMKSDEEKEEYLNELFDNGLDESTIKKLSEFDNEGYRLLFIILNYYLNKITKIKIGDSTKSISAVNERIYCLDEKQKKQFDSLYNKYKDYIEGLIEPIVFSSEDEIRLTIIDYLKEEAKTLEFDDIYLSVNFFESNMIFDVFFDNLKNYLGSKNNG